MSVNFCQIISGLLILLLGFTQHEAQGTTLALMVPPVGILAAWTYYKHGHVNLPVACFICIGFLFGGLIGAKIATGITGAILQKVFGIALFLVSLRMIFFK